MSDSFAPDFWSTARVSLQVTWQQLPKALVVSLPLAASCCAAVFIWSLLPTAWAPVAFLILVPSASLQCALSMCLLRGTPLRNAHVSPRLTTVLSAWAVAAAALVVTDNAFRMVGFGAFALLVVAGPMSIAYATFRDRDGLNALRGGIILVGASPTSAVSLLCVSVLGGFLAVASAGVALLVAAPAISIFALEIVKEIVRNVDRKVPVES